MYCFLKNTALSFLLDNFLYAGSYCTCKVSPGLELTNFELSDLIVNAHGTKKLFNHESWNYQVFKLTGVDCRCGLRN